MKENDFNLFLNTTFIDLLSPPYKSSITFLGTIIGSHDKSLSILLAKASFAFLLISMLFYWFQTTFKYEKKTLIGNIPHLTMWCANLTLALLLFVRWFESGHFPLSNLYESLIFLSWSLTTIHLVLEDLLKKRKESTFSLTLGAITSPVALFTNAFATFSLPQEMQKVTVLVPALQSNWLMMHVSVMIISYAALLSGSLLAVAFLAIKFMDNKQKSEMSNSLPEGKNEQSTDRTPEGGNKRGYLQILEELSTKLIDYKTNLRIKLIELSNTFFPQSYEHGLQNKALHQGDWLAKQQKLSYMQSTDSQTLQCEAQDEALTSKMLEAEKLIESDINLNIPSFSTTSLKVVKRGKKPMLTTNKEYSFPKPLLTSNSLVEGRNCQLLEPASKNETKSIAKQSFASSMQSDALRTPKGVSKKLMDSINNKSSTSVKTTPIELDSFWKSSILPQETKSVPSSTSLFEEDLLQILDNVSYRAIGLGFALLTIGILSGAVWANEAWGSYWSWDPKETWAFFTWLIFALYLHMRLSKGWVGKESAFVASFGFAVIWFCYLGVNLFGKGLHSYGWFH